MMDHKQLRTFCLYIGLLVWNSPCLSQTSCSLVMTIDQSSPNDCTSSLPDSRNITCNQLQPSLALVNTSYLTGDPVCVLLSPGYHSLAFTETEIEYSVHIVGPPDGETVVECSSKSENFNRYKEFPLKFGANASILLERVSFRDCARPLLFYETASVTVKDCHFSNFTQTALEIYNTPSVNITNSTFTDNVCMGQGTIRNSGNAGAVSIGYNETYPRDNSPLIRVANCTFTDNAATLSDSSPNSRGANSVLSGKIFVQRGGGIACYFSAAGLQSEVHISECVFEGNRAEDSGGGIYMNLNGEENSMTTITITNTHFINNTAMHGAGVEITFDTVDSVDTPNHLTLQGCTFISNHGYQGGAMKLPQLSQRGNLNCITLLDCKFESNTAQTGAAIHIETFVTELLTKHNTRRILVGNCVFNSNSGSRGVTFFSFNHVNFTGANLFYNNTGPSLRGRGSLVSLEGTLSFMDNRNHREGLSGAVYVSSFSQLLLNPGVNISFIRNIGQEGAALVVLTPRISSGFARTLYNPQCFLQFSDPTTPPISWADKNVSIYFEGNKAVVGPNIFISNLDACSWFNSSGEYFSIDISDTWSFITMYTGDNYIVRDGKEKKELRELYIQTQMQSLQMEGSGNSTSCPQDVGRGSTAVCASPGQKILLNVTALDQFNHSTSGFLRISQNGSDEVVEFTPSIVQRTVTDDPLTVSYTSNVSVTTRSEQLTVKIEPAFSTADASTSFVLFPILCLPGFHLNSEGTCECEDRQEVLACDDDNMKFVLLNDGLWGAPPSWSRRLVTYPCPPQYCNCTGSPNDNTIEGCALIYDDPSKSCSGHRHGVLCGKCMKPYGVGMLTMECREFTAEVNMYYWLIPILVLFIAVSVVIIVKLGVVIPPCLLGFLLYIQVSSVSVAPFNKPLRLKTHPMTYLNSLLSLYVPYDFSLHSRLSALEAYGLRYISPGLALLIVPIATAVRFHSRSWNGIWTLILLMYGMMTETAASLLFCPTFTTTDISDNRSTITVWFYDGSVSCFRDAHLALAILSILSLLLLTLLIPLFSLIAYHRELSGKFHMLDRRWLEKFSLSVTSPYCHHARWWVPFELARRLVFIVSVIFCPGYVSLPLLEAGLLLLLSWFVQPYRDWKANATEAFSLCMLVVVLCCGNTNPLVDMGRESSLHLWPIFYLPLPVAVVTAVVYFGWRISRNERLRDAMSSVRVAKMKRRRLTEVLVGKRNSVKTTEVEFATAVDLELSQM